MSEQVNHPSHYSKAGRKECIVEMEEKYGTLICSELSNPHGDWEGKARKKNCMTMITECAALAAKHAEEYLNEKK